MGKALLLIDDDTSFREVMRFHLAEQGYEIDLASDGQEGVRLFQDKLHKVVLTDLKMPKMDGFVVIKEVLNRSPNTVVIVITASGDIETAVRAMKAGAFNFVPKPGSRELFKLMIKKAFEHAQLKNRVRELENLKSSRNSELIDCAVFSKNDERMSSTRAAFPSDTIAQSIAAAFKAISHPTRVQILLALAQGEQCVCEISEVLGLSVSAASHQLSVLKARRLVKSRSDAKLVYYSLGDPFVLSLLDNYARHLSKAETTR